MDETTPGIMITGVMGVVKDITGMNRNNTKRISFCLCIWLSMTCELFSRREHKYIYIYSDVFGLEHQVRLFQASDFEKSSKNQKPTILKQKCTQNTEQQNIFTTTFHVAYSLDLPLYY